MKCILLIACGALASAQPAFDTASVKPVGDVSSCKESMMQALPGNGLRALCIPVRALITWAYQIQNYQLTGGPSWMESMSWDIMATSDTHDPAKATPFEDLPEAERTRRLTDVQMRLRSLLADRFQLTLRKEIKEQIAYTLVVAKNGPSMKEVERGGMIRRGKSLILATGATMSQLSSYLGIALGRPVTDKTGLTAYYAFELNWTPDGAESPDAKFPSLTTAVQEQLGLRLQSVKAPTDSFVIERIEKASEN
jgi:bla regulator protein BlaR1